MTGGKRKVSFGTWAVRISHILMDMTDEPEPDYIEDYHDVLGRNEHGFITTSLLPWRLAVVLVGQITCGCISNPIRLLRNTTFVPPPSNAIH